MHMHMIYTVIWNLIKDGIFPCIVEELSYSLPGSCCFNIPARKKVVFISEMVTYDSAKDKIIAI